MDTIPKEKGGVRSCTGDFCFFLVHRCLLRAKNQVTPSAHESGRDEGVDDSRGAGARVVPGDEVLEAHRHVSVVVSPWVWPPVFCVSATNCVSSEKLREEGRLRDDVNTEYDAPPTSWNDLKGKVSELIHGDDAPKPRS